MHSFMHQWSVTCHNNINLSQKQLNIMHDVYIIFERIMNADLASDRTKAERQAQVKPILEKLSELKLYASKFAAIKALMLQIQDYVTTGEPQQVNIVFPEFGRRIKGTLETNRHSESSIKMTEMN